MSEASPNNAKTINFLLSMLLALLFLQIFFPTNPPKTPVAVGPISFSALHAEYSVPTIPEITITNNSSGAITIDTCKQIKVLFDGAEVANVPPAFCSQITLASEQKEKLNLKPLGSLFAHTGDIAFQLTHSGSTFLASVKQVPQGFFHSIFSTFFYAPLYNIFVAFLLFLPDHNLGVAIILLTLLMRIGLFFWQNKMIKSQQKMAEIQPKIQKIQEKYKDDQAKAGMEIFELYKKERVNPLGSCLPLLIQMPIMIGVYLVVSSIGDISNAHYLYSFLQTFNPADIGVYFLGVNLTLSGGIAGLTVAILAAASQWLQIKLSTPVTPSTPAGGIIDMKKENAMDPQDMQKMMMTMSQWMLPFFLGISAFFFPIGVGLYWVVGTVFLIFQQLLITRSK